MTVNRSVSTAWKSEKGRRPENEDSCLVLTSADLGGAVDAVLVVADGMGGRASGSAASRTAVQAVRDSLQSQIVGQSPDIRAILNKSLESANDAVFGAGSVHPELRGMGTTCVVAAILEGEAFYSYMGDSRAYLLHEGVLSRLTTDHSFLAGKIKTGELTEEQAAKSRFRNVITKAVGLTATAEPDFGTTDVQTGDVLLLCTDGLTTAVSDDEIADILCASSSPKEACGRLVHSALKHGGRDNITVVIGALDAREVAGNTKRALRCLLWIRRGISISPIRPGRRS